MNAISASVITAIYVTIAARTLIVMRRQSIRIGNAGVAECVLALIWPWTAIFVAGSILLLDAPTPGFEKVSALSATGSK